MTFEAARLGGAWFLHNLLHPSDLTALQTDLDAMRMIRGFRQNILDDAFGQFARALVLFPDDEHEQAGFDMNTSLTIHRFQGLVSFRNTVKSRSPGE